MLELPPALRGRHALPFEFAVGRLSASGGDGGGGGGGGGGPRGTRVEAVVSFDLSRGQLARVSSGVPGWLIRLIVAICAPTIWTHALEAAAAASDGGHGGHGSAGGGGGDGGGGDGGSGGGGDGGAAPSAGARGGRQQPGLAAYGRTLRERVRADRTGLFGRVAKWTGQLLPWSASAAAGGAGGAVGRRDEVAGRTLAKRFIAP